MDLSTPDVAGAKRFYSAVFGWEFADSGEDLGGYVMASVKGNSVAGIGTAKPGARPAWLLYFSVSDAEKLELVIPENGGAVLVPSFDVGELGRALVATDPAGAPFGAWQAKQHIGAELVNEPGALTWEDLRSNDPAASQSFFAKLFGYRFDSVPMAPDGYAVFAAEGDEAPMGGIGGMMDMAGAPSHWIVCFGVGDADEAMTVARDSGGSVVKEAKDTPYGRIAMLGDNAGATFCVISSPSGPDRSG